ncbi:pilus assembly protein CpaE [Bordetella sp. 15P40C-2]|uniref:pilus assembly protein CpaE n=1 Tax=Bordetella sp. 15P40C-2 TaxID=2572246 RepID=UPI001F29CA37|nr:pilus assembly protein CpaE [Bordetella sp. 15P40C-2]
MTNGLDATNPMQRHSPADAGSGNGDRLLFFSDSRDLARALAQALDGLGALIREAPSTENVARVIAQSRPRLLFLDFACDRGDTDKWTRAAELARTLAQIAPDVPRIAVGSLSRPEGAIAALRAGVADFVDPLAAPQEVRDAAECLLKTSSSADRAGKTCRDVLLLGARPGVGVSTLAAHLSALVQASHTQASRKLKSDGAQAGDPPAATTLHSSTALLDLGWPIGDAQLYVNVTGGFDFAEAVRNLQRLDATLLSSAMPHTSDGLSVMALPPDPMQMNPLSQTDSLGVFKRLQQHFETIVTDAGGFPNLEFVASLARATQHIWIVTDQSVSALVSLATLLEELERHHIARDALKLVVNRYDERYGMTAQQIADRFGIALQTVLPDRSLALMKCMNQGRLLHLDAERDPYVRGVRALATQLTAGGSTAQTRAKAPLADWATGLFRRRNSST